jgi:hypothetical protein
MAALAFSKRRASRLPKEMVQCNKTLEIRAAAHYCALQQRNFK